MKFFSFDAHSIKLHLKENNKIAMVPMSFDRYIEFIKSEAKVKAASIHYPA